MSMAYPNCLDLDPQDGDLELLEELEIEFGYVPAHEQTGSWLTLGDIYTSLQPMIATSGKGACPSIRLFNLLRAALMAKGLSRQALRRETPLDAFVNGQPRRMLSYLSKRTGLRVPASRYAMAGKFGSIFFLIGFVGGIVLALEGQFQTALWMFLAVVLGFALIWMDKGIWPPGMTTLGDLSARVAALNHLQLGNVRDLPDSLWQRLTAIVAEQSEMPPQEMRADTLLFASRKNLKTG